MSLGTDLRAARESKKISLDDISKKTKIPMKFLIAIEEDRFGIFPSQTFAKGFIRAFAKIVGMDPALITRQFNSEVAPQPAPIVPKSSGSDVERNLGWRPVLDRPPVFRRPEEESELNLELVEEGTTQHDPSVMRKRAAAGRNRQWLMAAGKAAAALAVVALLIGGVLYGRKAAARWRENAARTAPVSETAPAAVGTAAPVKVADKYQHLVLKALDKSWVQVVMDDGRSRSQADMAKGDVKIYKALRKFKVRLGNAGGVDVQFNGKRLGVLGTAGQVLDITLPPDAAGPAKDDGDGSDNG